MVNDMAISGSYLYAAEDGWFEIFNISTPSNPIRVASISGGGLGIAMAGSYAYLATGGFLTVFNVATPSAPVLAGSYAVTRGASDVVVSGTLAYVAGQDKTLRVIDVSNPASMFQVGLTEHDGRN